MIRVVLKRMSRDLMTDCNEDVCRETIAFESLVFFDSLFEDCCPAGTLLSGLCSGPGPARLAVRPSCLAGARRLFHWRAACNYANQRRVHLDRDGFGHCSLRWLPLRVMDLAGRQETSVEPDWRAPRC